MSRPAPTIRPAEARDDAAIAAIYAEAVRDTTATFDTEPRSLEETTRFREEHGGRHPLLVAVDEQDDVLGWASLSAWSGRCAYADTAEVSIYVDAAARRRGVGRALLAALVEEAVAQGLHSLLARIAVPNDPSVRLHAEQGFRRSGITREVGRKFGRRIDVEIHELLLDRRDREPVVRSQLARDLGVLGVAPGDLVMVHASLRALGPLAGGPEIVMRALLDAVGSEGTLAAYVGWDAAPYHHQRRWTEAERARFEAEWPCYDPATSPAARDHGHLAELLRTWPGSRRSPHPEGSFSAVGARAAWLVDEHPRRWGYGPGTPLARLCEGGGKVLLLGSDLANVTLLHHAEHLAELEGKRVIRYRMPVMEEGARRWVEMEEFETGEPIVPWEGEDYFAVITREFLEAGGGASGKVGHAASHLLPAARLVDFAVPWMERHLPKGRLDPPRAP